MTIKAKQIQQKSPGETMQARVSFQDLLVDSDVLTGTPTVAEQTTTDLTITSVELNGSSVTVLGETVTANNVVMFKVAGGTEDKLYTIRVTVSTTGGSTFVRDVSLRIE